MQWTVREYFAARGSGLTDEEARTFAPILEQMGRPTAQEVVNVARNPASPFHSKFTWDDGLAAEKCRQAEARSLMAAIQVRMVARDGSTRELRSFYSVAAELMEPESVVENGERGPRRRYVPIQVVREDPRKGEMLAGQALQTLQSWYERHCQFLDVFPEFEPLRGLIESVGEQLEQFG